MSPQRPGRGGAARPRHPDGSAGAAEPPRRNSRWLAARVLVVQVVTLVGLWLLQATFGS